jgi:hypothetical protein
MVKWGLLRGLAHPLVEVPGLAGGLDLGRGPVEVGAGPLDLATHIGAAVAAAEVGALRLGGLGVIEALGEPFGAVGDLLVGASAEERKVVLRQAVLEGGLVACEFDLGLGGCALGGFTGLGQPLGLGFVGVFDRVELLRLGGVGLRVRLVLARQRLPLLGLGLRLCERVVGVGRLGRCGVVACVGLGFGAAVSGPVVDVVEGRGIAGLPCRVGPVPCRRRADTVGVAVQSLVDQGCTITAWIGGSRYLPRLSPCSRFWRARRIPS